MEKPRLDFTDPVDFRALMDYCRNITSEDTDDATREQLLKELKEPWTAIGRVRQLALMAMELEEQIDIRAICGDEEADFEEWEKQCEERERRRRESAGE